MAIVTRYFSTSGAGAADGTSWANRAALFDGSSNWSTVITGFDFSGSDSLLCLIGPGSYTCAQALASGIFTTAAPTAANPILLHGCDSSGNMLTPPDPDWVAQQPAWSSASLPVIATSSNIATLSTGIFFSARLLNFTASGRNAAVISGDQYKTHVDWCHVTNSTSNSAAVGVAGTVTISNSVVTCSGTSFQTVLGSSENGACNTRCIGNASASSGDRRGHRSTVIRLQQVVFANCPGGGVLLADSTASSAYINHCTIINCGAYGIKGSSTASQVRLTGITNCYIAKCTAGIDGNSGARMLVSNNRIVECTNGVINLQNYPTDWGNDVDASYVDTELVDEAGGDYRIKASSAIWGKGYGAGDEIPTAAAIATAVWARSGRSLTA